MYFELRVDIEDVWINDRSFLIRTIESHGGVVGDVPQRKSMHILIANRPLRTKRFLMALAVGIDIISIAWLKQSVSRMKLLEWNMFRLSNGRSHLIEHSHSVAMSKAPVFSRVRIHGSVI